MSEAKLMPPTKHDATILSLLHYLDATQIRYGRMGVSLRIKLFEYLISVDCPVTIYDIIKHTKMDLKEASGWLGYLHMRVEWLERSNVIYRPSPDLRRRSCVGWYIPIIYRDAIRMGIEEVKTTYVEPDTPTTIFG